MTLEPRERFSPMIPLAFFCVAALAHLCVVGGVLWRKKVSSRAAARNPPRLRMEKLSGWSFLCGEWQMLPNCIPLTHKPNRGQKWRYCNYSLSPSFFQFQNSMSQPKQESQSSLFVMDVAQLKGKERKNALLCAGFPWRASSLSLKFFGFHIAVSLMKRGVQKLFLHIFSQPGAQLDSISQQRRRWPWIKDTLLFTDIRTNSPHSSSSLTRERLGCPAAFPVPIPLCLISLYSGTVTPNKVCVCSKGIKHEQVPQCWGNGARRSQTILSVV